MPNSRQIKTGTLSRSFDLDRAAINTDARTVPLAFASEAPVERWFGREILDLGQGSVRLDRLRNRGALLMEHEPGHQIGVVESVEIGPDRKARAVVRFGRGERAEEVFQDVVDGIRGLVSVGYRIHKMVLEESTDEGDTYRATDWEPLEISIVSIPADPSVGIGRSDKGDHETTVINPKTTQEDRQMPDTTNKAPASAPAAPPTVDVRAIEDKARDKAIKDEQARTAELLAIGKRFDVMDLATTAIESGSSVEAFRAEVMEKKFNAKPIDPPSDGIGLTDKEKRQYSILRAIRSMDPNASREDRDAAGFELECSRAVAKSLGKSPAGIYMPLEVRTAYLNIGTASEGGNLKATDLLSGSFIDMLRNRMRVRSMGATIMSGLVGDIAIPRQSGGATAYWLAEDVQTTASKLAVDQVTLAPKTVAGMTEMTRKLLMQSSIDVENLVRQDLATTLALALDRAALHGRGLATYNEPLGLAGVTGIGSVAGGDNGLAPAWSHIVGLETEVAIDNADVGTLGYLTNSKVRGKLKQTQRIATYGDDMIWQDGMNGDGMMNGYRAAVSNQVSSALTKGSSSGVASAIFFGNWADLLIGLWGGLDLTIDPYTYSDRGRVRVVMMQDTDIAVRHPESFSAMLDALTS